jgi:hypothetical protein
MQRNDNLVPAPRVQKSAATENDPAVAQAANATVGEGHVEGSRTYAAMRKEGQRRAIPITEVVVVLMVQAVDVWSR